MRSIRARSALGALAAGLLSLASCSREDPHLRPRMVGAGQPGPRRGGVFRYAFDTDIRSLDPQIAYDEISGAVVHMLFDRLVNYAPGGTEIVPQLAERWEVSSDGRTYTFHLRNGLRFSNGKALRADDVQRSFERMLDPAKIPCPGTNFYSLIQGFDDFQEHRAPHLAGIRVLDPLTVEFQLAKADQTFLNAMAMPFAAPIDVDEAERLGRDAFGQHPVGAGPFLLASWEMGTRLVLTRNPHYWMPDHPYLDSIVLDTGVARHLQFMRFLAGDIDHATMYSFTTVDYVWIHQQPGWRQYVVDAPDISTYGIAMNTEMPPWNNVHLRRAVAFAIDREAICRARSFRIHPLGGLYPPGLPGYDEHLPGAHRYDPAVARREMVLAGYPQGYPGEIELWLTDGEPATVYGQLIQSDLAKIGIHVRLRLASFPVFLANTERRGAVSMSFAAWSQDFPDPSNFIETLFSTRSIQPENSQNAAFYSNPRLDDLLDRARVETDRARRLEMYREAERIVVDDAPWAFLFYIVKTEANQPYVHNYVLNPVFGHDFREVWLDLPMRRASVERAPSDALSNVAASVWPAESLLP